MKCKANNKQGKSCNAHAMKGSDYCYRHNPDIPDTDKRKASAKGSQIRKARRAGVKLFNDLTGVGDVLELLTEAIKEVWNGDLSPQQANSVGYLISIAVKIREQLIIEKRISDIEGRINK